VAGSQLGTGIDATTETLDAQPVAGSQLGTGIAATVETLLAHPVAGSQLGTGIDATAERVAAHPVAGSQLGTGIAATAERVLAHPVAGSQLGTGIELEITRWEVALIGELGWAGRALATKPVKTTEKTDAWTKSFMVWLPPGVLVTIYAGGWQPTGV
jgi:hypothetical protein